MEAAAAAPLAVLACPSIPFDTVFYPSGGGGGNSGSSGSSGATSSSSPVVVVYSGLIDGRLVVHKGSHDEQRQVGRQPVVDRVIHGCSQEDGKHEAGSESFSCRALAFTGGAKAQLVSGGSDGEMAIWDAESVQAICKARAADSCAVSRLHYLEGANLVVCGDDDGNVGMWDPRRGLKKPVVAFREHDDGVGDFCSGGGAAGEYMLFTASVDGTLSVFDIRRQKLEHKSENQEDELLSIAILRDAPLSSQKGELGEAGGSKTASRSRAKVVCGTQMGNLHLFSYGYWKDMNDRFPGHPSSIEALRRVGDEKSTMFVTGSSDGFIRALSVAPNKFRGIVGQHGDFPVERISLSADYDLLASASHDETVHLWDISNIEEMNELEENVGQEDDAADSSDAGEEKPKKKRRKKKNKGGKAACPGKADANRLAVASFFKDL